MRCHFDLSCLLPFLIIFSNPSIISFKACPPSSNSHSRRRTPTLYTPHHHLLLHHSPPPPLPKHPQNIKLLPLYFISVLLSIPRIYKQPRTVGFDIHAQDPYALLSIVKISQSCSQARYPLKRVTAIRIQLQGIGASAPDFRIL